MDKFEFNQSNELLKNLFFENVERKGECWIWSGYARPDRRYPLLLIEGKLYPAYRISLILHGRELPNKIRSLCGNKLCVNPDHLSQVKNKPRRKKRITTTQILELLCFLTHTEFTVEEIAQKLEMKPREIRRFLNGGLWKKQLRAVVNEPGYRPRLPGYYTTIEAIAKTGWTHRELQDISRAEGWKTYTVAHTVLYKVGDIDSYISQPDLCKEV